MIVLCPKAFAGTNDSFGFQREFLRFYLSKRGEEAVISNETWEAFRFRHSKNNPSNAEKIITHTRGFIKPETSKLTTNFEEEEPKKDYKEEELIKSTQELVERRWQETEVFIVDSDKELKKYALPGKIKPKTLLGFYISFMETDGGRKLIEEFNRLMRYR